MKVLRFVALAYRTVADERLNLLVGVRDMKIRVQRLEYLLNPLMSDIMNGDQYGGKHWRSRRA